MGGIDHQQSTIDNTIKLFWNFLKDKNNLPLIVGIGVAMVHAVVTPFFDPLHPFPVFFILMAPSYLSMFLFHFMESLWSIFPNAITEFLFILSSSISYGMMAALLVSRRIALILLALVLLAFFAIAGFIIGIMASFAFG